MADELFVDQDEVEGTASGVWSRMLAGNRRFAEGKPEHPNRGAEAREALVDTHAPEAAILSCSDARVSPDIIFDSGLGDLFTVRQDRSNHRRSRDCVPRIRGDRTRRTFAGSARPSELRRDQAGMQGIRGVVARVDRRRRGFADGR